MSTQQACNLYFGRALTLGLISMVTLSMGCASLLPAPPDDTDPELIQRTGKKAVVTIAEKPFQSSKGGYSWQIADSSGQTRSVNFSFGGWNSNRAHKLEEFFTEAMQESGAFMIIDREMIQEIREDEALRQEGILEDQGSHKGQMIRPTLKLVASITRMEDDASGSKQRARGGGFMSGLLGQLGGSRATQKAECEIKIKIVDRDRGFVVATASGEGFSTGSSRSVSGGGAFWKRFGGSMFGGSAGDSDYKKTNMEAALQRATVRAVNDLINKISDDYYTFGVTAPRAPASHAIERAPSKFAMRVER